MDANPDAGLYRQVHDLVSAIGNRWSEAYAGRGSDTHRTCRTRPKDFRYWDLRLPDEGPGGARGVIRDVILVEKLPNGWVYLQGLNLTVSDDLFRDARAYRRLFHAMSEHPIDPNEVDKILLERILMW